MGIHPSEAELSAYLANQLPPAEEQKVLSHLEDRCSVCEEIITRLEETATRGCVPIDLLNRVAQFAREVEASPPPLIRGYKILGELGRGGMAVVYHVFAARPGREAALKVIPNARFANPDAIDRFKREAEVLKALTDAARACPRDTGPGLAELYDVGETESVCYIEMELALGGTLRDRLGDLIAQPLEAARLVAEVADIVDWMHRQEEPVFHRDLKPSNILLQPRNAHAENPRALPLDQLTPRVSDLGLARRDGDLALSRTGQLIGTPAYMAPELVERGGGASRATEVYSLGATLFHALAGHPPFTADSPAKLYAQIGLGNPSFPSALTHIPRDLRTVCLKCLERNPRRRYATCADLAADLRRCVNREPVLARPPGLGRRAVRGVRRHPVLAALVAGLVVLCYAGWSDRERAVAELRAETDRLLAVEMEQEATQAKLGARTLALQKAEVELQRDRDRRIAEQKTAAGNAARRGDWPTALRTFAPLIEELARAGDAGGARHLRVERLLGYFATNDEAALVAELKSLAADPHLGDLAPRVRLIRGAHLLCDIDRMAEGRALITQALGERMRLPAGRREDVFPEADQLYGEALQHAHPRQVVEGLKRAVAADALHYPAHAALVLALFSSGDPEAAGRQAAFFQGVFPESPVPPLTRSLAALVAGDRPRMREALVEFGKKARADTALLKGYFEVFADALDLMEKHNARRAGLNPLEMGNLYNKIVQMRVLGAAATRPIAFPVPTVNMLFVWYTELFAAYIETAQRRPDDAHARLRAMAEDYPEALVHVLLANNRFVAATGAVLGDDLQKTRDQMRDVALLGYAAAERPTLAVRTPTRFCARFLGVIADVATLKITPDAPPVHLARVRDNLARLMTDGRGRWGDQWDDCVEMLVAMICSTLTPNLESPWHLDTTAGAAAQRGRNRQLYLVGYYALETWVDDIRSRPGRPKKALDDKAAKLRGLLRDWGRLQGVTDDLLGATPAVPRAPVPRGK